MNYSLGTHVFLKNLISERIILQRMKYPHFLFLRGPRRLSDNFYKPTIAYFTSPKKQTDRPNVICHHINFTSRIILKVS